MVAGLAKLASALRLLKDENGRNTGKKIVIVFLSPFIALVLLIGGIFSDGTTYNHNLIHDLYYGNSINTSGMDNDKRKWVIDTQAGIQLLNTQIEETNKELKEGSLDPYLVKGYYIGIMLTEQKITIESKKPYLWVESFTKNKETENTEPVEQNIPETEENNAIESKNRVPITSSADIYTNIENSYSIKLTNETKATMEKVYSGLLGQGSENYPSGTVVTLSKEEIKKLVDNLPKGTSQLRKDIIIQAADAVGKIPYYWGGSATVPGYDGNRFGMAISPDADGRTLKGLDCSHFVDWVYWTVMGNNLGNTSTHGQITQCDKISKSELLPGDLAFLMDESGVTTHVGIYAGTRDNQLVWIHENAAVNNVSMDTVSYWTGYYRLHIMKGK